MVSHSIAVVVWLLSAFIGYLVVSFAGWVWGVWYVERGDKLGIRLKWWGLAVTPAMWLLAIAWGLFAFVQACFEFFAALNALGAALPG